MQRHAPDNGPGDIWLLLPLLVILVPPDEVLHTRLLLRLRAQGLLVVPDDLKVRPTTDQRDFESLRKHSRWIFGLLDDHAIEQPQLQLNHRLLVGREEGRGLLCRSTKSVETVPALHLALTMVFSKVKLG